MSLKDLYTDIILDHYRNPRQYGSIDGEPDVTADGSNPLCGDEVHINLSFEDGTLEELKWEGQGCAISQASASMMSTELTDMDVEEIEDLVIRFRSMMQGELTEEQVESLGDLQAIQGVTKFPIRIKCAVLAWNTLQKALAHAGEEGATVTYEEEVEEDEVPDEVPGPL